jgi:SRSO17 transposase
VVACDAVYGRDGAFRAELDRDGIIYIADIPNNYQVYVSAPLILSSAQGSENYIQLSGVAKKRKSAMPSWVKQDDNCHPLSLS